MRILRKSLAILSIAALSALPSVAAEAAPATAVDPTGDVSAPNDITALTVTNSYSGGLAQVKFDIDFVQPPPALSSTAWSGRGGSKELLVPLDINKSANSIVPAIYVNGTTIGVVYLDLVTGEVATATPPNCGAVAYAPSGNRVTLTLNTDCLSKPTSVGASVIYGDATDIDIAITDDLDPNDPLDQVTSTIPGGQILLGKDGGIFNLGDTQFYGSTGDKVLNQPVVAMAKNPTGEGYWFVAADGGVFTYGPGTQFYGSQGANRLNQPIVGMAPTPSGKGYWLVAADGGIFTHGDAQFYGSTGSLKLNKPIVGMAVAPGGNGYYLVASDGGVFTFGTGVQFYGSTGSLKLNKPITAMATTPNGYYLLASDGGVFAFGTDAPFYGSAADTFSKNGITAVSILRDGSGYRIVGDDGTISNFGTILNYGDLPSQGVELNSPIVGAVQ